MLTLVYVEDGLAHFACEERLRQVSEELFDHVRHVIRRLILVVHIFWGGFTHLPESLNTRLYSRFAEKSHLKHNKKSK